MYADALLVVWVAKMKISAAKESGGTKINTHLDGCSSF